MTIDAGGTAGDAEKRVLPYPQEVLLIEAVGELAGHRVLCTSAGLAQFAEAAARQLPDATVTCNYLDLYRADLARAHWSEPPPNLRLECASDLPQEEVDAVAFPFSAAGEAELTRELIQAGHERLRSGGKLFAATDNAGDSWLGEQMRAVFRKVKTRTADSGVLYIGTKADTLKKLKNFTCEFAFRDRGRLIRAVSRPGVFSHRHIDPGARRLLDAMDVEAGARVLDIGCGAGVVALAAACRAERVQVHAVDSNARAVECAVRGAELNGLANITTELNADGHYRDAGQFDLALANPPYYSGIRIASHFLSAGRAALRSGGRLTLVTKSPDWYVENMGEYFDDVTAEERKGYYLFQGVRPAK